MEKIIFKDYPDKTTPLNADNLNQLQTNVENALDEKFDKSGGTITGDVNITGSLQVDGKQVLTYDDTGWIYPTLNSGWTNQYHDARVRYRKINGIVYVEAFVSATTEASNVIFTLPTGFRPTFQYKRFPVYTFDSGQQWCQILPTGTVEYLNKSSSVQWFCINVSFPAN